jgi:hypothetical protein
LQHATAAVRFQVCRRLKGHHGRLRSVASEKKLLSFANTTLAVYGSLCGFFGIASFSGLLPLWSCPSRGWNWQRLAYARYARVLVVLVLNDGRLIIELETAGRTRRSEFNLGSVLTGRSISLSV